MTAQFPVCRSDHRRWKAEHGQNRFLLNVASMLRLRRGYPVAVFSLEMSKEQLVIRMLCSEARVEGTRLRTGFLNESDWPRLTLAAGNLSDAAILHWTIRPRFPFLNCGRRPERLKADQGLGMVIIDYLSL